MWTGHVRETPAMFLVMDLFKEGANIHVYDTQDLREDMWSAEMSNTCGISPDTNPKLDSAVIIVA